MAGQSCPSTKAFRLPGLHRLRRRRAPPVAGNRSDPRLLQSPTDHIGDEMMISIKTVSAHRTHILDKLGGTSTAELVPSAARQGIIH